MKILPKTKKKSTPQTVFVGLSGGVDSSVAALLLKERGYNVVGVFMKNWSNIENDPFGQCSWRAEREDAQKVADALDIPLKTYDFEKEYREKVFSYFLAEYKAGRTPNPDVMCNKLIKFDEFLRKAMSEGADFIATGHYAKSRGQVLGGRGKGKPLQIPKDKEKDQTYFLHALSEDVLKKTLFPLEGLTKKQVRKIALKNGLATAMKKESMGICFVGEVDLRKFLSEYIGLTPGKILTLDGKEIGKHDGVEVFTIGQRRGLMVGGTGPYYVVKKDMTTGDVFVTNNPNDPALMSSEVRVSHIHWISGKEPKLPMKIKTRLRHRAPLESATLEKNRPLLTSPNSGEDIQGGKIHRPPLTPPNLGGDYKEEYLLRFKKPQRAPTPGQSAVFYKGKVCLGGGIIVL